MRARTRCLAVDLGAGSGRVLAGELTEGRLRLAEFHRFPTPRGQQGDYLCWDIAAIEAEMRRGIAAAAAAGPVASLGIDGWGVDYVLLDEAMERVAPAVCYRDGRTAGMMERLLVRLPSEAIYRRTGIQFQPFNTLFQLAATAVQQPEWLQRARHLMMLPDWFNLRLGGAPACEFTNATTTQMLGLDGCWDETLLAAIGCNPALFAPPLPPGTEIGGIDLPGSRARLILPATHDTASAVAAAPLADETEAYLVSGTWSLIGFESQVPFTSPAARALNVTNEGGVGGRRRILKNIPGMWLIQQIRRECDISSDAALAALAADAPGWRAVIDPAAPGLLNPPSMCAAIRAQLRASGQPEPADAAGLARCVFDSLALSYAEALAGLQALCGRSFSLLRVIGGGSRNVLLNQLCADCCGLPVEAGPVECSAIGNICVQLIALGELADLQVARALVRRSFPISRFLPHASPPSAVCQRFRALNRSSLVENLS